MSRQEIIEKLCSIINNPDTSNEDKSSANELLHKVIINQITEDEAELILSNKDKYWSNVSLPSNLFDNLKKYKKGKLSDIQVNKMVSSLITRCLIEIEFHPDMDKASTGLYEFLEYLNSRLGGRSSDINLLDTLCKYGLISDKEVVR